NTAWRATGEPDNIDYGHLILGERVVDRAISTLDNTDIRLAVFHHPLAWLSDVDQAAVESRLQAEFDMFFCGHVHRASPELKKTSAGDAILSQAGCLYNSRDYFNGYNIINFMDSEVEIEVREYSDERRRFIPAVRKLDQGRINYPLAPRGI